MSPSVSLFFIIIMLSTTVLDSLKWEEGGKKSKRLDDWKKEKCNVRFSLCQRSFRVSMFRVCSVLSASVASDRFEMHVRTCTHTHTHTHTNTHTLMQTQTYIYFYTQRERGLEMHAITIILPQFLCWEVFIGCYSFIHCSLMGGGTSEPAGKNNEC